MNDPANDNDPIVTSISFDCHGFFALEIDGGLVSWATPRVPEPPEVETVVEVGE